ncbi:MAG: hypothetical protein KKE98_00585 [Nanoarchaeota archaeon]|nr:hypothetical protein [Nanoarchaeota archaeon]MBU1269359.1 hypothetical protein [Nanoarchaeota archaeon]MBU1596919.1 hypothetical protein [Nanoarchaeota archaeon]
MESIQEIAERFNAKNKTLPDDIKRVVTNLNKLDQQKKVIEKNIAKAKTNSEIIDMLTALERELEKEIRYIHIIKKKAKEFYEEAVTLINHEINSKQQIKELEELNKKYLTTVEEIFDTAIYGMENLEKLNIDERKHIDKIRNELNAKGFDKKVFKEFKKYRKDLKKELRVESVISKLKGKSTILERLSNATERIEKMHSSTKFAAYITGAGTIYLIKDGRDIIEIVAKILVIGVGVWMYNRSMDNIRNGWGFNESIFKLFKKPR